MKIATIEKIKKCLVFIRMRIGFSIKIMQEEGNLRWIIGEIYETNAGRYGGAGIVYGTEGELTYIHFPSNSLIFSLVTGNTTS